MNTVVHHLLVHLVRALVLCAALTFAPSAQARNPSFAEHASIARRYYVTALTENVEKTSRTLKTGTVDTSGTSGKADTVVASASATETQALVRGNVAAAAEYLYENRNRRFDHPKSLEAFFEHTMRVLLRGVLREGESVWRRGEATKYAYTPLRGLDAAREDFFRELLGKLDDRDVDPVELAAWVEYRVNLTDHFCVDGSSKGAQALAAFVLMRRQLPLPTYRERREILQHRAPPLTTEQAEAAPSDDARWKEWFSTYRTFFYSIDRPPPEAAPSRRPWLARAFPAFATLSTRGSYRGVEKQPTVIYLSPEQRELYRLRAYGGRFYDAHGELFDTSDADVDANTGTRRAIYSYTPAGALYAIKRHAPNIFKHTSAPAGEDLAGAGEMMGHVGLVDEANPRTGHYHMQIGHVWQLVHAYGTHKRSPFANTVVSEHDYRRTRSCRCSSCAAPAPKSRLPPMILRLRPKY